jgi:HEAT repeat protein
MENYRMRSLATTFNLLSNSENEAAAAVLLAALDSSQRDVRDFALAAVLDRGTPAAELTMLRRWGSLSDRWKQQIADRPGWLSNAIRASIFNRDPQLFDLACSAATFTRDYEAIPYLVAVATDKINPFIAQATTTTLELAELLADELSNPRDYRIRRDPRLVRDFVIASLERATEVIGRPHARELLEAFLLLANRDSAPLKRLLQSPRDAGHDFLLDVLTTSSRPSIERLVLSYLDDPHAPYAAAEIIGRRGDISFLRQLARKLANGPSPVEKKNLQRISAIAWLPEKINLLDSLREAEQPGAIHLVVESSIPREEAFDVLAYLLRRGSVASRRIAAPALAAFTGTEADQLAVQLLDDDDLQVRAAAAAQLRPRNVPGAVQRLVALLDSDHPQEREVAQANLKEYNFDHFAALYDQLTPESRISSGSLVRRIDPRAVDRLQMEMASDTRSRKQRALELAVALGAVDDLRVPIAALLGDEDQYLRIEAVRVLATTDSRAIREILRDALLDSHPLVQQAAENALAELNRKTADTVVLEADRETVVLPGSGGPAAIPAVNIPSALPLPVAAEALS